MPTNDFDAADQLFSGNPGNGEWIEIIDPTPGEWFFLVDGFVNPETGVGPGYADVDLTVRTVEHEDFVAGTGAHKAFMTGQVDEVVYGSNEPALAYFHKVQAAAVGDPL